MTVNRNTTPEGPNSPWLGFVKFVFIVIFTLLCFLLAQSMMRHHFLRGGRYNNREPNR